MSGKKTVIRITPSRIYQVLTKSSPLIVETSNTPPPIIPFSPAVNSDSMQKGNENELIVFNILSMQYEKLIKPSMIETFIDYKNIVFHIIGQCDALNDNYVFEIKTKVTASLKPRPYPSSVYQLELYLRLYERERGFIVESKNNELRFTKQYKDDILFYFILDNLIELYEDSLLVKNVEILPIDNITDVITQKVIKQKPIVSMLIFNQIVDEVVAKELHKHLRPAVEQEIITAIQKVLKSI